MSLLWNGVFLFLFFFKQNRTITFLLTPFATSTNFLVSAPIRCSDVVGCREIDEQKHLDEAGCRKVQAERVAAVVHDEWWSGCWGAWEWPREVLPTWDYDRGQVKWGDRWSLSDPVTCKVLSCPEIEAEREAPVLPAFLCALPCTELLPEFVGRRWS